MPRTLIARRVIATSGWSTANALRGVIARSCMIRKRRVVDDLLALEDREQDRPEDLCQEAEVLDPIGARCVVARTRHDLRPAMAEDPTKQMQYQNNPSRVPTLQSPERPFASTSRKMALASLETSVATLTKKTKRLFPSEVTQNRRKRALVKNPMPKAPAA